MYTLQKAAAILNVTDRTVRSWIKQCNIGVKIITTDRRRGYISDNDMLTLVGYYDRKTGKKDRKKSIQRGDNAEIVTEENWCSLARAASFLGVSAPTLRSWITKHNIEKRTIATDRKRLYISNDAVFMLADLYKRTVAGKVNSDGNAKREEKNLQEGIEKRPYSIAEVASYLNVSQASVKRWITLHNIEKKINNTGIRRVYIAYQDVLMLANLHKRDIVQNKQQINIVEEIKEIRGKLKELASEIEDIKHDMRIYAKRAIYVR